MREGSKAGVGVLGLNVLVSSWDRGMFFSAVLLSRGENERVLLLGWEELVVLRLKRDLCWLGGVGAFGFVGLAVVVGGLNISFLR